MLQGSDRATVARLVLITDVGARSVVVKTAKTSGVRERAALEVLRDLGVPGVPVLLGTHDDPPMLVLEDLGSAGSLADRLLGTDPEAAAEGVYGWAEAIGRLQAATLGAGPALWQRLAAASTAAAGDVFDPFALGTHIDTMSAMVDDAITRLTEHLPKLGVSLGSDAADEMRALDATLRVDVDALDGPGALTPGDACPDNNIETPDGLVLIDFEVADFRHVAWDAAYLTEPWPTCWCSWRLPSEVTAEGVARWRATIEPALAPRVIEHLDDAVRAATVLWTLITAGWQLGAAIDGTGIDSGPRPALRLLVQHRLGVAAANLPDGELRRLVLAARAATVTAWGEQPLPLAPAWRS